MTPPHDPDLGVLVDQLEARLQAAGALIAGHWRPGADPGPVAQVLASFGLTAPHEVITWFGWHDGTDATPPGDPLTHRTESILLGGWVFYTLDQSTERRRSEAVRVFDEGLTQPDPHRPGAIGVGPGAVFGY